MRTLFGYAVSNWCGHTRISEWITAHFLRGYDFLAGLDDPENVNYSTHFLRDGTRYRWMDPNLAITHVYLLFVSSRMKSKGWGDTPSCFGMEWPHRRIWWGGTGALCPPWDSKIGPYGPLLMCDMGQVCIFTYLHMGHFHLCPPKNITPNTSMILLTSRGVRI